MPSHMLWPIILTVSFGPVLGVAVSVAQRRRRT
jgi:hypothetical protein